MMKEKISLKDFVLIIDSGIENYDTESIYTALESLEKPLTKNQSDIINNIINSIFDEKENIKFDKDSFLKTEEELKNEINIDTFLESFLLQQENKSEEILDEHDSNLESFCQIVENSIQNGQYGDIYAAIENLEKPLTPDQTTIINNIITSLLEQQQKDISFNRKEFFLKGKKKQKINDIDIFEEHQGVEIERKSNYEYFEGVNLIDKNLLFNSFSSKNKEENITEYLILITENKWKILQEELEKETISSDQKSIFALVKYMLGQQKIAKEYVKELLNNKDEKSPLAVNILLFVENLCKACYKEEDFNTIVENLIKIEQEGKLPQELEPILRIAKYCLQETVPEVLQEEIIITEEDWKKLSFVKKELALRLMHVAACSINDKSIDRKKVGNIIWDSTCKYWKLDEKIRKYENYYEMINKKIKEEFNSSNVTALTEAIKETISNTMGNTNKNKNDNKKRNFNFSFKN